MFIGRKEVFKPAENMLVSQKPAVYGKEDLWVGNVLQVDNREFALIEADDYCLKYMELNSQEVPTQEPFFFSTLWYRALRPVCLSWLSIHCIYNYCYHTQGDSSLTWNPNHMTLNPQQSMRVSTDAGTHLDKQIVLGYRNVLSMCGPPSKYGPLPILLNKTCNIHFVSQPG